MKNLIFFIQNHYFPDVSVFFANSMLRLERGDEKEDHWKSDEKIISDLSEKEKILYLTYLLVSQSHELGNLSFDLEKWSTERLICKEEILLLPTKLLWLRTIPNKVIGIVKIASDKQEIPYKPLLLFKDKLYLHKTFVYQQTIIESILERKLPTFSLVETLKLKDFYSFFISDFSVEESKIDEQINFNQEELDWQNYALFLALVYPFMILSGGPGTGKTTTVFKILILLLVSLDKQSGKELNIQLVAPTGKSVKRLQTSLLNCFHNFADNKGKMNISPSWQKSINEISQRTMTIHRFLSSILAKNLSETKYSYQKIDVLVVDEATMISLEMLAYLFNVLKPSCRIIFLGDKDQLSSIGERSLLSHLLQDCNWNKEWSSIQSSVPFKRYRQFLQNRSFPKLSFEQNFKTVNQFIEQRTVILQKNYRLLEKNGKEFRELILTDFYRAIISQDSLKEKENLQKLNKFLDKTNISSKDLQFENDLVSRCDFLWSAEISEKVILQIIEGFFCHYIESTLL